MDPAADIFKHVFTPESLSGSSQLDPSPSSSQLTHSDQQVSISDLQPSLFCLFPAGGGGDGDEHLIIHDALTHNNKPPSMAPSPVPSSTSLFLFFLYWFLFSCLSR